MRRVLALLVAFAFVVPALPEAPKTCEMGCAKTSACCCAKRGTDTAETRLTLPSARCCRSTGVPVAASVAAIAPATAIPDVPTRERPVRILAFAPPARTTSPASPPRAPPAPPVAI